MRDRGDLLTTEAEKGRGVSRRDMIGVGALTGAILLLSACGSNESPVPDPTAKVPGTDSHPSAEKSPGLIIDEQAFNSWGSMTQKERELLALNSLDINNALEVLPSYSTGAGSYRDTPKLMAWLERRHQFIQKVYEQNPVVAKYLTNTLITEQYDSPLKENTSSNSIFDSYRIYQSSDIGNYRDKITNETFSGFFCTYCGKGEVSKEIDRLLIVCSLKKDVEGNRTLQVHKSEEYILGGYDPNPSIPYYVVNPL